MALALTDDLNRQEIRSGEAIVATVSTINTIEDLVRIMDERPEWVEAMRARLLTREVLELPQRISTLADKVDKYVESTNRRLDNIGTRLDGHDSRFDQIDARFDTVDARFDAVDGSFQKLRDDMAPLKAAHARNAALEEAITIAHDMGLRRPKTLSREDLWNLTDLAETSGIPTNELRSFRLADLVMEAKDQNGETCYIAAEISFTANGRDTSRAIRNAEFLTRFTGKRSYAAVAGLIRDDRIRESVDSGEVHWHQLDPDQLEVE